MSSGGFQFGHILILFVGIPLLVGGVAALLVKRGSRKRSSGGPYGNGQVPYPQGGPYPPSQYPQNQYPQNPNAQSTYPQNPNAQATYPQNPNAQNAFPQDPNAQGQQGYGQQQGQGW